MIKKNSTFLFVFSSYARKEFDGQQDYDNVTRKDTCQEGSPKHLKINNTGPVNPVSNHVLQNLNQQTH